MTLSAFTLYLAQNERHAPPALVAQIKREARQRLTARLQSDRADSILCFADLARRIENAIAPR